MRHPNSCLAAVVLLMVAIAPAGYACSCGPRLAEPNVYIIEVLAKEPVPVGTSTSPFDYHVDSIAAFLVYFRVTETLRGTPLGGGKLLAAPGHVMLDCGPPLRVGAAYVVGLTGVDLPKMRACDFAWIWREDGIETLKDYLKRQETQGKPVP